MLAQKQSERIGDLLAYSSTIMKASEEYEDTLWLQYDARFRRQAATDPKRSWAVIDASPWTTCFTLAKAKPQCTDCKEVGHAACRPFLRQGTSSGRYQAYTTTRPICRKFNYNGCDLRFCNFRHVCLRCNKPAHKVGEFPDPRKDNELSRESFREPFRPQETEAIKYNENCNCKVGPLNYKQRMFETSDHIFSQSIYNIIHSKEDNLDRFTDTCT